MVTMLGDKNLKICRHVITSTTQLQKLLCFVLVEDATFSSLSIIVIFRRRDF